MDADQLLKTFGPKFKGFFEKYGIPGASVGIVQNGKQVEYHHGKLGLNKMGCPTTNTMYLISSMSKPYIATALGVLIAETKESDRKYGGQPLSFDTVVGTVIPELADKFSDATYRHPTGQCPVRIGDLVDHRLLLYRSDLLWEDKGGETYFRNAQQIIELLNTLPLDMSVLEKAREGGQGWEDNRNYTNIGFCVAAIVIERVLQNRGEKDWHFWQYLQEKVFKPAKMERTTANIDGIGPGNLAAGHSTKLTPDPYPTNGPGGTFLDNWEEVMAPDFKIPTISVQRSKASNGGSYMAAAAGVMSSVKDQLIYMDLFMKLWNQPEDAKKAMAKKDKKEPSPFQKLQNGILVMQEDIRKKIAESEDYTYLCGWNRLDLPHTNVKHRAAGTEGDTVKRTAIGIHYLWKLLAGAGEAAHPTVQQHPFLKELSEVHAANPEAFKGIKPEKTEVWRDNLWPYFNDGVRKGGKEVEYAFYHCGNMVGATSLMIVMPTINTAVVVCCNFRGYYVDGANLVSLGLADCLFYNRTQEDAKKRFDHLFDDIAPFSCAQYLTEVRENDRKLHANYTKELQKSALADLLVGDYYLIGSSLGDDKMMMFRVAYDENNGLTVCRDNKGHQFPLRVKNGTDTKSISAQLRTCFALPTAEWNQQHMGGKFRNDYRAFEILFLWDDTKKTYDRLYWNFENLLNNAGEIKNPALLPGFTWHKRA